MAKWFCGNVFAFSANVAPCFSCVPTVIGDSVIAVSSAAIKPGCGSGDAPIADTSKVWKDGSIIGIGSGITGSAGCKCA